MVCIGAANLAEVGRVKRTSRLPSRKLGISPFRARRQGELLTGLGEKGRSPRSPSKDFVVHRILDRPKAARLRSRRRGVLFRGLGGLVEDPPTEGADGGRRLYLTAGGR